MPVLEFEIDEVPCKIETNTETYWVAGEQDEFNSLKELKARVKKIKTTRYEHLDALLIETFSARYQVVKITRPLGRGRAWITRADKSRETVDTARLIAIQQADALDILSAELKDLREKEKAVREKIDNLPRSSMPREIEK